MPGPEGGARGAAGRQPTVRSDTDQSLLGCQIAVRSGGQQPYWQMVASDCAVEAKKKIIENLCPKN